MGSQDNVLKTSVAVVGGGPAGCVTAISCALAGLDVLLIERERFPRHRPGETLHPGIETTLGKLGVLERVSRAGFLRHPGICVSWGHTPRFVPYGADDSGPWRGFQAWRADFDAILLERAREVGVEVWQPARVLAPILSDGRIVGMETSLGPVEASFVVDGAGSRHWLARRLGLKIHHRSPRLIARFGYVEGSYPPLDRAPAIVADASGWTWTARVRPGLYHWTRLNLHGEPPDPDFVPQELRGLRPQGGGRGADVSWRAVREAAGPGYVLVGDAAAVLDPASSHGVLKAMLSGIAAAHLIAGVLAADHGEETPARRYTRWMVGSFENDARALQELYARFPGIPRWPLVLQL